MATNIGPKISVEGEAQYRKQMAQIIAQQKALAAEMKATVSGFTSATSAQEKARASASVLDRQIANLTDALEALAYRTAVYNTTAELNKLKNQLGGTADAVEDTGDAMEEAGRQGVRFGDLIKANVISDFIVDGLREIASAAKDMAASFVQSAADVRAETAQYAQTFGELAGEADAAIQQVADSANTLPSLLKPAATSIYAFARSSGRSLSDVTETLQSFLKGNYENDAALGVSATETTRNAEAMKLFGKEFNDLSEIQKQQTLLQMVVDAQELSGAMGQAAREADSWANVQGNLDEAWRQFSATNGQAMLDALIPVIQEVTDILVGLTDGSLTAGEALQQAFGYISQQAAQAVGQLPGALQTLGNLGSSIAAGISSALPQIQAAASGLVSSLKQGIEANFPQLLDSGLQALTSFTAGLRENIGQIVDQGLSLVLSLAQGIADGLPSLIEQVPQIVSNIAGIINDNAPKLLSAGVQIIVTLGQGLIQAVPTLLENIPQIVQAVYDVWKAMNWVQLGTNVIDGIINGVKSLASGVGPSIQSLGNKIIDVFKSTDWKQLGSNVVNGIINGVKSLISSVIPAIKNLGSSIIDAFKNIDWRQLGNAVITGIINVIATAFSFGSGVIQAVIGLAGSIVDAFLSTDWLQLGRQIVQGLIDGIKGLASGAVDAILGVGDGIVAGLKNVLGIHSPSTVAEEIGVNLMRGLAIGMKDSSGEVMETVDDIASELETRFSAIQDTLSNQQSIAQQSFDNWLSTDGQDASSAEVAARQIESLTQQLSAQQSALQAAEQAYTKIVELYGAGSAEALKYQKTLLEQAGAFEDLQDQIDQVKLDEITAGYDDLKESMDAATSRAKLDFDIWQSEYADTATESETLQRQLEYQNAELENQAQVVEQAKATYQQLCDTYGATSDEAQSYIETLDKEITTYADLKDGVKETTDALEESNDKLAQFAEKAGNALDNVKSLMSGVSSLGSSLSGLVENFTTDNPFTVVEDPETARNRLDVLTAQYEAATAKVNELTMAFNQSVEQTGAASEESQDLADQLADAESEASGLKKQVDELSASLNGPTFGEVATWAGSVASDLVSVAGSVVDLIPLVKSFAGAISSGGGLASVLSSLGGVLGSIGPELAGLAGTAGTALSSIGAGLVSLAGGPVGVAVAAVVALGGAFALASADGDTLGEKLKNVFAGIGNTIKKLVSSAFNWGADLIQGFVDGIASMVDTLFGWIGDIAQGIASFLHFSRPDKGPLREYEQWMPDMIAGMARGIRLNTGVLEGAAQDAASRMQSALTIPADVAAAAVGTAPAQSSGRSLTITIGDVIVNGSSVQDVDELADLVVQKITRQVQRKEAAYGLV